jgi:phenylpropionate dioxygenase-like ring-hydroxylating dioxygenase large terminal subunit
MVTATKPQLGSKPTRSYQDFLAEDSRPVPALLGSAPRDFGTEPLSASRYTSEEFFKREAEKVFMKTWQFACLDDEIPEAGDTHLYELLDKQLIIVRQADGSLKAFKNVCLHRGRKLVTGSGCKKEFRCPYHAFVWNTDGTFRENPFAWDFPQINPKAFGLHEVRVESWAGFVFINFDRDAEPLLRQLAPMPEHFVRWRIDRCYKSAHVAKIMSANWKVCAEAFIETHHVIATHPQYDAFTGHDYTQYDVLSDHVTRFLSPSVVSPSSSLGTVDDAHLFEIMMAANARSAELAGGKPVKLPPGTTSRAYVARASRQGLEQRTGYDLSDITDAEILDGIAYDFFPNFHLWGGFKDKICYRFRPWKMDPEKTLFEVMLFALAPNGSAKPPPAKMRLLAPDEAWTSASELGALAGVYDQDESNMAPVQEGLRTLGDGPVQFGKYLESRCRSLHHMIDCYMAR